jgi:uncharacterized protein (DUF362 family)/NAD-dependent dihydropyrimidine dehydrogenase PreA subunit
MSHPVYYSCPGNYGTFQLQKGLNEVLQPVLKAAGGVAGKKVLLKPNLLFSRRSDDPAAVHPAVILAVSELLIAEGATVTLLENPGTQRVGAIIDKMAIGSRLRELGVTFDDFTDYRSKVLGDKCVFRQLRLAREFEKFDLVFDLAKAKTHAMMTLTLAVKNLFGLVDSTDRIAWHLAVGSDFNRFADLLLDLYLTVKPQICLIDGITGMEGNGPGSGTPVESGFLAASTDALALDASVAQVLGVESEKLILLKQAKKRKLDFSYRNEGDVPVLPPYKLPDPPGLLNAWGVTLPPFFKKSLRNLLGSRPVLTPETCISCGRCEAVCPPRSLRLKMKKGRQLPVFDLNNCIRCYCCQEHCPKGAIETKAQLLTALFSSFVKWFRR